MGKISNYARVLKAKLQDVFVIDTTDSNVTSTKSVTVEQIGDTIAGTQVHSDLKTDNQTIIGGINELAKAKNIADEYDDTHTYNTGDITIYGNTLYICNTNNTTGDFDPSKWTATTIDNVIGTLSSLTTTVKSSLVGAVNEVARYTPVYGNTASGSIATFDTSLALPLQDCTIAINAEQEAGTPTPADPKSITGFTGANIKVAGNLLNGNKYQLGEKVVLLGELASNTYSTYLVKGTYTISFKRPTYLNFRVDITDSNGTQTNIVPVGMSTSATFTITESGYYKFGTWISTSMISTDITEIMLTGGSEVKPYTAYVAPTTTPITWQDEAGTVYGGLIDVTTGVLTITHYYWTDDGTKNWIRNADGSFYVSSGTPTAKDSANGACNYAPYAVSFDGLNVFARTNGLISLGKGWGSIYSDATELKAAFAITPIQIVYPLATPITVTLTPTQISAIVGTNNVFTDTNGDTSVVFACSLKDYIDSQ